MSQAKIKKLSAKALKEEEEFKMPTAEEAKAYLDQLFQVLDAPHLQTFLQRIYALSKKPPQVVLIEGADEELRFALSLYYACLVNCKEKDNHNGPCRACAECLSIVNGFNPDIIVLNGLVESIKIDTIRELIPLVANAPTQLISRMIIFYEALAFTKESANALLKTLEEPNKTSNFVMTVATRERLYPTLVSRSIILSLPTKLHRAYTEEELEILQVLNTFFRYGTGFFEQFTSKKTFSMHQARLIIHLLMSSIALAYSKEDLKDSHAFVDFLANKLNAEKTSACIQFIEESTDILENSIAPKLDLIIDTLLVQSYMLIHQN